ncbi:MAG: HAD family phosphatase [Deltaproteobacteria bacterium]|nr:HAD family phosphatase [Deltaproteobacteria bacterium]
MTDRQKRGEGVFLLEAVIFDMDGVIADTEPLHARAYIEALGSFGIHVSESEYRKAVTEKGKTMAAWFGELGGDPEQITELYRRKDSIYFPLLRKLGTPRPGLLDLLSQLKESAVPCVLATSSRRVNAEFLLDLFGLRGYFVLVLALEDVSRVKPDPEVFLLALEKIGGEPGRTVVIEDSPKGVLAALAAGIPVVVVPTFSTDRYDFDGAALRVESLEDLSVEKLDALLESQRRGRISA